MKAKTLIITPAVIAAVGLGALTIGNSFAHGPFGQGGPGYGPGNGMHQGYGMMHQGQGFGPGMMHQGQGFGPGMMRENMNFGDCPRGQGQALQTPLSVGDVRANLEQHLQRRGNDRLKVGTVTETDDKTITAEIVTLDDSLVRKIEIDKATGQHMPVQ